MVLSHNLYYKVMKTKIGILSFAALALLGVSTAFADTTCTTVYGGGQTCVTRTLSVNKTVQDPTNSNFVDNLGSDKPFDLNGVINFQITVTNTGGTTLNNVNVNDTIPQFVSFAGGAGSVSGNNLTFNIGSLNAGQSNTQNISFRVTSLPNQQILCEVNQVSVTSNEGPNGGDSAQFCIRNQASTVTTVTKGGVTIFPPPAVAKTPSTGPEALALIGLLPAGGLGAFLRKKTSK